MKSTLSRCQLSARLLPSGLLSSGLLSICLLLPLAAGAQAPAAAAPMPVVAPPAGEVVLEDAYKREFALLETQKRELQAQIAAARSEHEREQGRLSGEVSTLESRLLAAQAESERLAGELARTEQQEASNADNADLVAATLEQARSTLGGSDAAVDPASQPDDARLQATFDAALQRLAEASGPRSETGVFFLPDGSEVQGTLIRYGNIAAFGVSDAASGALAPAGGGRFRLWPAAASAETAEALAAGQTPTLLRVFLFESADTAVADPQPKSLAGEVAKGGVIGYLILLLGSLAMALVALRAVFLQRAGASIGAILDAVQPAMHAGAGPAIAAVKRFKGSAARVVTAALRNIGRDREHLEDIVSESILHESSRLARFGAVIMTIAAVAPLLGLLGTVTGMIQTFDVITEFGTSDPKLLSGGIAVALVTTELGLVVAIPCLLAGSMLNGWAERIKDDMEKAALRVITLADAARSAGAAARREAIA